MNDNITGDTTNIEVTADGLTVYEVCYLILPTFTQEQAQEKATSLKESIISLGGTIVSDENPVSVDLAYSMVKVIGTTRHKCQSGYFGWIKFELSAPELVSLKKSLDANLDVLRYLIVKTVKENTLLNGKMMFKKEEKSKFSVSEDVPADVVLEDEIVKDEVLSEDIDKTIDDLVTA